MDFWIVVFFLHGPMNHTRKKNLIQSYFNIYHSIKFQLLRNDSFWGQASIASGIPYFDRQSNVFSVKYLGRNQHQALTTTKTGLFFVFWRLVAFIALDQMHILWRCELILKDLNEFNLSPKGFDCPEFLREVINRQVPNLRGWNI